MPEVMKTLLLNPPSFVNFDGGPPRAGAAVKVLETRRVQQQSFHHFRHSSPSGVPQEMFCLGSSSGLSIEAITHAGFDDTRPRARCLDYSVPDFVASSQIFLRNGRNGRNGW